MRVTERLQIDAIVSAIRDLRSNIFSTQEQITSGKQINRPSDDPAASKRIYQFQNVIQTTEKRVAIVQEGSERLNHTDGALTTVGNTLQRVKELAIQGLNDTLSANDRSNIGKEVNQLFLELVGVGNTQANGRSLFGGHETQTDPYQLDSVVTSVDSNNAGDATVSAVVVTASSLNPHLYEIRFTSSTQFDVIDMTTSQVLSTGNSYTSGGTISFDGLDVVVTNGTGPPQSGDVFYARSTYSYQGDSNHIAIEIGDGKTVSTSIPGSQVFSGPSADVFSVLQELHQALVTNDSDSIKTVLGQLDTSLTQVNNARADLGARVNRLDTVKEGLELLKLNTESLRSEFEDADLAKVASELASLQTNLQASMATLTRQFETTLLNFLR